MAEPGDTLALARRQGYRDGYEQARSDARALVTEVMRCVSEHLGVEHYGVRIETLRHVRAALAAIPLRRGPVVVRAPEGGDGG